MKVTRLSELRRRALLTQQALAEQSGVHRNTISKLEAGERGAAHAGTAMKLAKALGVQPRELGDASPPLDQASRKSSVGRLGLARGTNLAASKAKVLEGARLLQEALDDLDEDGDPKLYYAMEFASLLLQGLSDEEAEKEANDSMEPFESRVRSGAPFTRVAYMATTGSRTQRSTFCGSFRVPSALAPGDPGR